MTTEFTILGLKTATLDQKRQAIMVLKMSIKEQLEYNRQEKEATKVYRAAKAAERREVAIAKAQAKLQRLLDKANPVGAKAIKANKQPSACTVTTMA
jgi:hypothetical protein